MLKVDADTSGIAALISTLAETGKAGQNAAKAALRDLRKQVLSVTKKEAAKEAGVPQKAVKTRWISDPVGPNGLRVWVGTNPLPVAVLGKPRQYKTKAKAGQKHDFPRAFVATMKSGHRSIFMRRTSSAYDRRLYRGTRYDPDKPWSRLPIAEALGPDIHEYVERSFDSNRTEFEDFFRKRFFAELNQKMKGRKR